ncbi:MAG: glycoside-pentoside-hexuronide (GPH):cation symporter [Oscillospiraceae bacterium]|nr:glycoside-pentoside-hexuronide (GPH):cation symporter [Oscillospiraceae bacterium]
MTLREKRYVAPREYILYGVANGGQVLSWNMLGSYIVYFYTNIFNVDKKIVSAMMLVEGIWDAVNDPLMGSLIDKTRTRYGKLRPYLLAVPVPLAITTVALFAGPLLVGDVGASDPKKVVYMVLTYFIWEFFYTVGDVPFWGLSAAISPNPEERTRAITSARFISKFVGFLPGLIIPIITDLAHAGAIGTNLRHVFFGLGVFVGVAGMGLFSLAGLFVKERVVQSSEEPSLKECLKGLYTNRPLRLLILRDVLSAPGGVKDIFSTYYYVDVLGTLSISLLTGIPGTVTDLASFATIGFMRRHFNNKQILLLLKLSENIIQILKYVVALGGRYKSLGFMIPVIAADGAINGLFGGVRMVIPTDMIGETVDYAEWTTGQRTEGISFSVTTFVGKFGNAVSRSLGLFFVDAIGYKTSNDSTKLQQSEHTQRWIFAMHTIVPVALGVLGYIPILMYDLVGQKREKMYAELAVMRQRRAREVAGQQNQIQDDRSQAEDC